MRCRATQNALMSLLMARRSSILLRRGGRLLACKPNIKVDRGRDRRRTDTCHRYLDVDGCNGLLSPQ